MSEPPRIQSAKFHSWTPYDFSVNRYDWAANTELSESPLIIFRQIRKYDCCQEPYPSLHFSLVIRWNPVFYNTVMVYPSALLSLLTPVIFLTPPSVHDRNGFGKGPLTPIKSGSEITVLMCYLVDLIIYPELRCDWPLIEVYMFNSKMFCVYESSFIRENLQRKFTFSIIRIQENFLRIITDLFGTVQCNTNKKSSLILQKVFLLQ